jgi:Tol biopolymer transport system component
MTTRLVIAFAVLVVFVSSAEGSLTRVPPGVIAFMCGANICAIGGNGRGLRVLAHAQDRNGLEWSTDGSQVAFTRRSELWVMRADGSRQRRLTRTPAAFEDVFNPVWAPNGRRIAFVFADPGGQRIGVVNVNGSGQRVLVDDRGGSASSPAWSPDGTKLAYTSATSGSGALYVADRNGNNPKRLTPLNQSYGVPDYPTWSPDGRLIAFMATKTSFPQNITVGAVYAMRPDGTHVTRLTPEVTGYETPPRWSPNGNRIAFACLEGKPSYHDEMKRMCVVRRDGSGFTKLSGPASSGIHTYPTPSWSPDGRWITYDVCTPLCRVTITPSLRGRWRGIGKPVVYDASPVWRP